ncbi:hypothetical protein DICPUDRAFT_38450 [Dictyostelium purpureum]|uniref:Protein kinase domain-containing protein n=1 Tax=Dictyostelium purpureum TaxID=5786 RepID=F0ZUG6_DICPU|nr:uncharacterized protein DICPUDRAFT_38450 [Dictyostelium purpureum]EGC32411.1 hypothetical protein DICPUDRAFT_38450 [Dictyostelium purpureum]|eukprot:XP_003291058.1 hypothetical protein DICPUDRAFT_38450 [Dictyostelium purpureum]
MRVLVSVTSSLNSKNEESNNIINSSSSNNNNSNKVFIEIHPNQLIWMIKTQLFNLFKIPPARQQLYLKVIDEEKPRETSRSYSKLLHSYRLVKDYKMYDGSELQMVKLEKEIPSEFLVPPKRTITAADKLSLVGSGYYGSQSSDDLNSNTISQRIHVLSSKKGEECPALCFAIGKGLYRGISGVKYEIKLYRVDSKGVLINSTSCNFQIDIVKKNSTSVDDRTMAFTYDQRKHDYSLLTLQPTTYGDYSISIKIDNTPICGSPFQCTIIDELNPRLKELAFSNEWNEEIVELITLISNKPSTIDNLFSFGIEGLVNLMFYPDPTVQIHITGIFAKLMEKDKNKERVLREYGMEFIFKLVSLDNWSNFMELRRLLASSLCILSSYKPFIDRFLKEVGMEIISLVARSEHIDCPRSCAIFLSRVSEIYEISDYLANEEIKETLIYMLHLQDNITINCTLKTISNLSSSFDLKKESNIKLLSCLLDCCKDFKDISKKVLIFKSFSNFCVSESLCTFLISNGILDLITPTHDKSGYFGIPMFCQWESNSFNHLITSNTESNLYSYNQSFSQIFKEETDYIFFLSLTISNMLVSTTSLKIHDHFSKGNGLNLLKQFILCHECSARSEAFRSFMIISNSPNDQCKKHLIQSGIIPYLVSSLFDSLKVETPFIVNTLANLCRYDPCCVENMGMDDIDKFIELLHSQESIAIPICYILSHLIKQEKYKTKIVRGGGKRFLHHLIEFVRQGDITILKPIYQQDFEITKEIGHGVSGTVWKGTWNGYEVAIKSFNEENLSFNEREFHSETTIMSVLRHDNIVHCIGGSRTPGKMFLVCDYYSRGSLYKVIHANVCPLSNARIVHIALQAAKGMSYLHSLGIIHRDLKSGNLLIDQDWNVRISDFGVSRVVDNRRMTKAVGTACYMAVEVLQGTEYTQMADVYSFAFVLWECISRQIPYHDLEHIDWVRSVLDLSYRPPIPETCIPEIKELIVRCWETDPQSRPNFDEIVVYLEDLRNKMQEQGLYEGFRNDTYRSSISENTLNENIINSDMSMHPTEELKNLVEQQSSISNQNSPTLSDFDVRSSSTSSSPISNISAAQSPNSLSPIGSTSTSPVLSSGINGKGSDSKEHKWERFVPDKNLGQKRLSAFRSNPRTVGENESNPISIKGGNHNNVSDSLSPQNSKNSITFSSSVLLSSTASSSGIESSCGNQDSFLSESDNSTILEPKSLNTGGFSLPPPPLHPSFYASMINDKISPDSSIKRNTLDNKPIPVSEKIKINSNNNNINNINNSNKKDSNSNPAKIKPSESFEVLKAKFDPK